MRAAPEYVKRVPLSFCDVTNRRTPKRGMQTRCERQLNLLKLLIPDGLIQRAKAVSPGARSVRSQTQTDNILVADKENGVKARTLVKG